MNNPKKDLSIIILSYNTKKITQNCLKSVLDSIENSNLSCEIIVVDNASTDGSIQMLEKTRKLVNSQTRNKIKILLNERNLGYGQANNQAVEQASSDYILFLNSDILVLDGAIDKLYNFYRQNEKSINFLGGKLLNRNLTTQQSCGPFYTLSVVFFALFLKGDCLNITRYSPNSLKRVDWISGACILTRREYFNRVGGFDENIFMYMDEIDLFYRAKKSNLTVFFYPEAKFIHLGFASSGSKSQPVIQVFRGLLYFYKKHKKPAAIFLLRLMLKLKASIALLIGKVSKNQYLISTYEQAYKTIKMVG